MYTRMCVHACILKPYYPTGRSVHSYVGNAATHQGQEENSLNFMLYLGLFTALAKQKSDAKPVSLFCVYCFSGKNWHASLNLIEEITISIFQVLFFII